ncbi:MAG: PHP domain-containing protein [Provencibacterium sp.]|jgi:hypothetical protein|nr:PHP domain-containing protein [Provencibacterium sp.]
MKKYLLPQEGIFFKANLHAHTTLSDGRLTPEQLKDFYLAHGYSIVAYTDHRRYAFHKELCDEHFLALAAYEVDINEWPKIPGDFSRVKTYHINLYDCDPENGAEEKVRINPLPERRYGDTDYINHFVEEMRACGFLACYNHPYWSLQNYEDYKDLRGFFAMEIYNHGCEIDGLFGAHPQAYDEMLRTGSRLFCLATDDNHNSHPAESPLCDSFGGFTMIKAPALRYGDVIEALKAGSFYSSTGPLLEELTLENKQLHIRCSPVEKIYVITEGRRCYYNVAEPGQTLSEATFTLQGDEGYFRVDCRDSSGRHAYSNAYFLDQLMG